MLGAGCGVRGVAVGSFHSTRWQWVEAALGSSSAVTLALSQQRQPALATVPLAFCPGAGPMCSGPSGCHLQGEIRGLTPAHCPAEQTVSSGGSNVFSVQQGRAVLGTMGLWRALL